MVSVSPATSTSPGKRPCTLSYLNRCALASGEPRSLMATGVTSSRPLSIMARKTSRPIPLIATFTDIGLFLLGCVGSVEPLFHGGDHRIGGDPEMLVHVLIGRRGAERGHSDKGSIGAEPAFPAE